MPSTLFHDSKEGDYHIKLESEHNSDIALTAFHEVILMESMFELTPTASIVYTDQYAETFTDSELSFTKSYNITYGLTGTESNTVKFYSPDIKFGNSIDGQFQNIAIKLDMFGEHWDKVHIGRKSRSWKNRSMGDIVGLILSDIGIEYDIEETNERFDVIQPAVTNEDMIHWLAARSTNKKNDGSYLYGTTVDNKFLFKSMNTVRNQATKASYILFPNPPANTDFVGNFATLDGEIKYNSNLMANGKGHTYHYFDYDKKEFVSDSISVRLPNQELFHDVILIENSHVDTNDILWNGRDIRTKTNTVNKVGYDIHNLMSVKVRVDGNININICDIIELDVSLNDYESYRTVGQFSGKWIVVEVKHVISIKDRLYNTELVLTRSGFDTTNTNNFVNIG